LRIWISIKPRFDYLPQDGPAELLVARGLQAIGCKRQTAGGLAPMAVPGALALALADFEDTGADLRAA
jgi:hypothetical protein